MTAVRLTEGEAKALLASALLVILSAVGRLLLSPDVAEMRGEGLRAVGVIDSALAVAESTYSESERRRTPLGAAERIDPNQASEVELDRLPGVGPSLARAIVRSREQDGPFRSLDDLLRVPGLGQMKLEQLAAHFPEQIQWNRPDGGFFIFVQLPKPLDASDLLTEAIEHNVAFVAGEPFFIDGSGAHTFRLSYSQSSEAVIEAAVAELGKLIKKKVR